MSDDDDVSGMWREMRQDSQQRRAQNRQFGPELLRQAGIAYVEHNGGAHLVVEGRYDYWPGTGLWMARGEKAKQRGVRKLIQRLRPSENSKP